MAEELIKKIHAQPRRISYFEPSSDAARGVSPSYPLPTFQNEAAITAGLVDGWSHVHKFGDNLAVGTSYVPVATNGIYRTPQVSGAVALRVKAGDANDTAAGSGARSVTLEGLDETGAAASETIATNGTSAGAASTTTFLRLFRIYVASSGTYASSTAGSHAASIVIETAGGVEWGSVDVDGLFAKGQSYIGAFTVPLGKEAYVQNIEAFTDTTKLTDIVFFARENILETAPPYSPMRAKLDVQVKASQSSVALKAPLGPFPALTDIGFMAKVDSGTAEVDVNFEIWLRDTT